MTQTHEDKASELVVYELGYHLVPTLTDDELELRVQELRSLIGQAGGTILHEGFPERHDLAYTIRKSILGAYQKFDDSYFGWFKFEGMPEGQGAFKEGLDHFNDLVRYIVVKTNADAYEPTAPKIAEREKEAPESKGIGAAGAGDIDISEEEITKAVDELIIEDEVATKKE